MKILLNIVCNCLLLLLPIIVSAQSVQSDSIYALGVKCYKNRDYYNAIKYFSYCDSLDMLNIKLNNNRKNYSKIWIASSYYKLGKVDSALNISPNFYKYPPIDRRKTIISDSLAAIATSLFDEDKHKDALNILVACAKIEKDSLGENNLWYQNTMNECGYLSYNLGDYEGAVKYGEIANNIALQLCGANSDKHIESLTNLINYYGEINNFDTARKYLKELELITNDIDYNDNGDYADKLMELAGYYEALKDYNDAVRLIAQANEVDGNNMETRNVRNFFLFENLFHLHKYNEAISIGQETINSFKNMISPSDSAYLAMGVLYTRLADCYYNTGNYIEAANLFQQAIRIYETSDDYSYDSNKISTLNLLSSCFNYLGLYNDAIITEQKLIEIMKGMEDCDSLKYAIELSNLAYYYNQSGNTVDAYILCEEAYNIINRQDVSPDNPDKILILSNLASNYGNLGNYSKAVELNRKVLSIRRQAIGSNSFEYATSLNNLATFLSQTNDYDIEETISLQKESINILESLYGKENEYYIESLSNLAVLYEISQSYNLSIKINNDVLELLDKLYQGEDHPLKINTYYNIANVYNSLKQYESAINNLKKAYAIIRLYGLEDNSEYLRIKKGLFYSYLHSNNIVEAKKWMKETYNMAYQQVVGSFPRLSSKERELFWNLYSEWFYEDLPQLIPYDSSEELAQTLYNSCLLSKGILLSTNILIDKLLKEEDPLLFKELQKIRQNQKILESLDLRKKNLNVDSIIYNKESAERRLLNESRVYSGLNTFYKINYQDVKKSLGKRDLAIEFITMPADSNEVYYALCLKKDYEAPHIIRIGNVNSIFNSVIPQKMPDSIPLNIWESLQEELLDAEVIFFSPIGELHKIGIEYAPGMEKYDFYRLSSTRNIIEIRAGNSQDDIKNIKAELFGGIDYEIKELAITDAFQKSKTTENESKKILVSLHRTFVDSLNLRGLKISYLPGTLQEVHNIKKAIEENHQEAIVHSGAFATETSVKALSNNAPKILHIATHGFYFTESRAKKEVNLRFLTRNEIQEGNFEDKSLTRSGLLFAGAKSTLKKKEVPLGIDDGILTAKEISELDLRGIDLVVLSACETGNGDIIQGEGVFGLQRGFKKAGVRSILMSLWKVSDVATEMLMTEFYNNICEGKGKRESLRLAQKKVREYKNSDGSFIFQDPHYWAGFVMLD